MRSKGLRMTHGQLKGRILRVPEGIRPTSARVRTALMNAWQYRLPQARVLDVFAGSGSVGLEAAARGAGRVDFVEGSSSAIAMLKDNCSLLEDADTRVLRAQLPLGAKNLTELLRSGDGNSSYDLIFVDPPYRFEGQRQILEELMTLLVEGGELAIEHSSRRPLPPRVVDNGCYALRTRIYGDSQLTIMAWTRNSDPERGIVDLEEAGNAA